MSNIFIMALEPLETRYTGQWFHGIPSLIEEVAKSQFEEVKVHNIAGDQTKTTTTPGAFLDFAATNIWKNTQLNTIANMFQNDQIKPGDKILFTDAWHTGVIQVRYMSELLGIPVEIHSMWHAGSYDPQDFLGRLIKDKSWSMETERALFHASHYNYFATKFHRDMFLNTLFSGLKSEDIEALSSSKTVISGQPHNVLIEQLRAFKGASKKKQVLFPHRVAPEKQPEIFRDLAKHMPDVEFIICQEKNLSKQEYHTLLSESMIVFSANLQETLGISAMEAVLVGTIPLVPNRLSYAEMYSDDFMYPSHWTESFESYEKHRDQLIKLIYTIINNYESFSGSLQRQEERLLKDYLHPGPMLENLLK